jgi:hypothetical protein
VADEIVELVLGEIIALILALMQHEIAPGIHRISPDQERECAELWLTLRDSATRARVPNQPIPTIRTGRAVKTEVA